MMLPGDVAREMNRMHVQVFLIGVFLRSHGNPGLVLKGRSKDLVLARFEAN
jgi:hypothetical protein